MPASGIERADKSDEPARNSLGIGRRTHNPDNVHRGEDTKSAARGELDQEKRTGMYREVHRLISAESGTIVPALGSDVAAVSDKVGVPEKLGGGWEMDGGHFIKGWWMKG